MTDTTRTQAQLETAAARKQLIVGDGQSLEADDRAIITSNVAPLLARLAADRVVDIADTTAIPVEYFNALAELLGNVCAPEFEKPYSEDRKRIFEAELRRTASQGATYETLRTESF